MAKEVLQERLQDRVWGQLQGAVVESSLLLRGRQEHTPLVCASLLQTMLPGHGVQGSFSSQDQGTPQQMPH